MTTATLPVLIAGHESTARRRLIGMLVVAALHVLAWMGLHLTERAVRPPREVSVFLPMLQARPGAPASSPAAEVPLPLPIHPDHALINDSFPPMPDELNAPVIQAPSQAHSQSDAQANSQPAEQMPAQQQEPAAAAVPTSDQLLQQARLAAGKIDRDLRNGQSGVPAQVPSTPFARFQRGVEAASTGGGGSVALDRYVAPDGVVITRLTSGSGARCFTSMLANLSPADAINGKNLGSAREVACPTGQVSWQRHG
ncbi:MAG: hypothetical protein ACLGI6_12615 [Gammaproteobacteria bacterium]